ncbi:MAG TPA: hypothetical protein VK574_12045 [Terracidiphilus sp.]|nr:hypothetical protein [Terracidiphilus sp.]
MASKLKKTVIGIGLATLTTLAGAIATSMWERFVAPFDLEVDAQYIDAAGANRPAVGAVLALPVVSTETTDEGGRAYWKDVVPHWTEQKQIVVDPPYEIVSAPPLFLRRYSNPVNVLLRKAETQQAAAAPAPAPPSDAQPAAQPAPQSAPQPAGQPATPAEQPAQAAATPAGHGLSQKFGAAIFKIHPPIGQIAEHVQLSAKAVELVKPPAALTAAAGVAPALPDVTDIYRSGPQMSGAGKNFSAAYDLCSGDPARGYVIKSNRFQLAGDRQCGQWATCKPTRNEATKVCWQFTLQGHEEQTGIFKPGQNGQAYSEGVLSVVWTRATK